MSFNVDWTKLDEAVASSLKSFLNSHLTSITLPEYIGKITISALDFGATPPSLTITNLSDPLPGLLHPSLHLEFYLPDPPADDIDSDDEPFPDSVSEAIARQNNALNTPRPPPYYYSPTVSPTRATFPPAQLPEVDIHENMRELRDREDVMLELSIEYSGDMKLSLNTSLIINNPTPNFLVLPISLKLTGFGFNGCLLVAYIKKTKSVGLCLREGGGLTDVRVESEVGDGNRQGKERGGG
jgi:distribution and morphology protein 12